MSVSIPDKIVEDAIAQAKATLAVPRSSAKGKGKEKKAPKPRGEPAPEPDWDRTQGADERDVRLRGPPCNQEHDVTCRSNQHAIWTFCLKCGLRMSYTPRIGKSALHRSAGPLVADTKQVVSETAEKEDLAYNPRLKDAAIGLQAAENSALKQLERIRIQKAKVLPALKPDDQKVGKAPGTPTTPPKSSAAPASSSPDASSPGSGVILIEEPPPANPEDLPVVPGNKRHQGMTAEEQEYQSRTTT